MNKLFRPSLKKAGILLMIVGVLVFLYVPLTWAWGYFERWGLRDQFAQEQMNSLSANEELLKNLEGQADWEKIKQLAFAAWSQRKSEQPIAMIEIPRIGVNAVVVEGTDTGSLRKGPGHMEETAFPGMEGNFAVAGDRVLWGGPFLNIDELSPGDEIIVKTTYAQFTYKVNGSKITDPEDTSVLTPTASDQITLITCDPPWDTSHRLIVTGGLADAHLNEGL